MKILLTGACGYVGTSLFRRLKSLGHEVYGVDTQWFWQDPEVKVQDVRTIKELPKLDAIIHLAAIANDPSVNFYPVRSWETAVLATQQMLQAVAKNKTRFIFASSVSVYGADRGEVTEDMDVQPLSDYNKTKMCAERIVLSYPECSPQIIRPATICGISPRMRLDLTVNLLTAQAVCDGKMTVHGGDQWRPSIHMDDMIDLYVYMLEHPELTGIWNAGFENHSIKRIAEMVSAKTGAPIEYTAQKDARSYRVNSNKLLQAGFQPRKTINDAIDELRTAFVTDKISRDDRWINLNYMRKLEIADA